MRFYIRNKTKYDPSAAFKDAIIAVDVEHTQEIGKIKEEVRKIAKGCKITALYVARRDGSFIDLADDRTINFYNLQDGMILETTSNPFWVTGLYSNMKRREQEAATNPEDARLCAQAQKSFIHRCMAIGLLFNGTGETEKQPPTFHALDDLYEYCSTQGKKPAYMSQFTLDELQEMFDMFQEELQNKTDPIGAFIYSQALKLGYLEENNGIDAEDPFRSHFHQNAEQQRLVVGAQQHGPRNGNAAATGGGRRRRAIICMCGDCEVAMATSYCGDCNPPLRLCDNCWTALHRGATRRNHQRRDLSEAPRQTSYIPQAYRAPFAMLVAFHRASQERMQKGSLTAEELKTRGQPFTDTDLEEAKQRGKPFSGFDSLENALIKNEIVLKEAAGIPKYSLLQSGQGLALKCSNFDYAVQTLLQEAAVPTIPVPVRRPILNNRQACLLVDTEEPQQERFVKVAQERGLLVKVRKLATGDFCWILLPPGVQTLNDIEELPDQELVLPYLVERKTWSDLYASVRSPRFENQVQRMKSSSIKNLFYLVEGSPKDIAGRPGPEVEKFLQSKLDHLLLEDKFFVNRTPSWLKTVEWLVHLTNLAVDYQHTAGERNLMTFTEFTRRANHHTVNANRNAKNANGIVWSADQFAENISSHHRNEGNIGRVLGQASLLSDSVLVIQGLTAYNTNCHSLYKRTLADYLQMPGQTAKECVQIHLEDYTHQLVSINVFQYYTLYLEVFKDVRIYRTETQEETEEFLSRFGALENKGAGLPANAGIINNFDQPGQDAAQRIETDLMFANDSQEEDFMLQQALHQSLAEDVSHKDDRPSSSKLYAAVPQEASKTHSDQNNNTSNCKTAPCASGINTAEVKQEHTEEEDDLQSVLQFKLYDELQDNLQQGLISSGCKTSKQNHLDIEKDLKQNKIPQKDENYSEDEELQRILQESKLQYDKEQAASKMGDNVVSGTGAIKNLMITEEHHQSSSDVDDELQKALEESRLQYEMEQRASKLKENMVRGGCIGTSSITKEHHESNNDLDDELQKALEESRLQFEMDQWESKGTSSNTKELHKSNSGSDDELQRALEESRLQFDLENASILKHDLGKNKNTSFDSRKEDKQELESKTTLKPSQDSQLQSEMKLRENETIKQATNCTLVGKNLEDRVSRQDSRKEIKSGKMDGRQESEKANDQNYSQGRIDIGSKISEQQNGINNCGRDQNNDFPFSGKNVENEMFLIDSQEDNSPNDIYHDFEIPDYVNQNSNLDENNVSNQDENTTIPNTSTAVSMSSSIVHPTGMSSSHKHSLLVNDVQRGTSIDSNIEEVTSDNSNKNKSNKNIKRSQGSFVDTKSKYSSIDNDAIYIDSQEYGDDDDDNGCVDDVSAASHTKPSDKNNLKSFPSEQDSHSSSNITDAIFIDSQDDIEEVENTKDDYEIAQQLQEELNKEAKQQTINNHQRTNTHSSPSHRDNVHNQIDSYREEQQQRFRESKTGKSPSRRDPGLAFRQKAELIAKGKVSLLSATRHQGRDIDGQRRYPEKRGFDGKIKENSKTMERFSSLGTTTNSPQSMTARKSCSVISFPQSHSTPRQQPESNINVSSSLPYKKARKSCNSSPSVFPQSHSPPPSHSESSLRNSQSSSSTINSRNSSTLTFPQSSPSPSPVVRTSSSSSSSGSFTFPASSSSSSHSRPINDDTICGFVFPPSSPSPSENIQHSTTHENNITGTSSKASKGASIPKCSDCGEVGHRKGTKRCPYYYTEEAQRKREEQARKRKEKRDEEDREQQIKVDALVAEHAEMAQRTEQLQNQIEQLNQRNNILPRMIEDAMKSLKKKRRK